MHLFKLNVNLEWNKKNALHACIKQLQNEVHLYCEDTFCLYKLLRWCYCGTGEEVFARQSTWVPLAAGPVKPASRTSSAAEGAEGGLRRPGHGCNAAVVAGGGRLRTAPAGSCHCSPEAGGCWPQPTASRERAGGGHGTGNNIPFLHTFN